MTQSNSGVSVDTPQQLIIDIEQYFQRNDCHPEPDPGVIIIYRYRVDEQNFETRDRHKSVKAILTEAGKEPKHFDLGQYFRVDGAIELVHLDDDDNVDFGNFDVERFTTAHKPYSFYINRLDYHTRHEFLTVRQILVDFAKVSPDNKTLAIKKPGEGFHEYKDLDEKVSIKDCPYFTLFDNNPTGVS